MSSRVQEDSVALLARNAQAPRFSFERHAKLEVVELLVQFVLEQRRQYVDEGHGVGAMASGDKGYWVVSDVCHWGFVGAFVAFLLVVGHCFFALCNPGKDIQILVCVEFILQRFRKLALVEIVQHLLLEKREE